MNPARSFTDLIVWQKAHKFVLSVYQYTISFPKDEVYALTSQFKRAAISAAANIAEGFKQKTAKSKLKFYNVSQGSLEECRYYMLLAKDLNYGENALLGQQIEEVSKLLDCFIRSIEQKVVSSQYLAARKLGYGDFSFIIN
jgi:four helix bundle protein